MNSTEFSLKKQRFASEYVRTGLLLPETRLPHYAVNKGVRALAVHLIVIKGADVAVTVSEGQVP